MRRIRIIEHISLDGVIQGPGGPGEDRENGFDFGGWAFPHSSEEGGAAIDKAHGTGFDLLLGRKTAREKIASLISIIARRDASLHLRTRTGPLSVDLPLTREEMADLQLRT